MRLLAVLIRVFMRLLAVLGTEVRLLYLMQDTYLPLVRSALVDMEAFLHTRDIVKAGSDEYQPPQHRHQGS
jgi:hypothetical protein